MCSYSTISSLEMITFILFLVPALDLMAWHGRWKLGALHLCLTLRRCRRRPQLGTPHHGPLAGHLDGFLTSEHLNPGPLHYLQCHLLRL